MRCSRGLHRFVRFEPGVFSGKPDIIAVGHARVIDLHRAHLRAVEGFDAACDVDPVLHDIIRRREPAAPWPKKLRRPTFSPSKVIKLKLDGTADSGSVAATRVGST